MTKMHRNMLIAVTLFLSFILVVILYLFNIIPHRQYSNADFNIASYKSAVDLDDDGIDDQTDILESVKKYISTNPKYQSKYYNSGYPDDEYGVCTDVVTFGLKSAGYDLRELVDADIKENSAAYNIEKPDKNIDFRRVRNLKVYFSRHSIRLTNDLSQIDEWQGGDIVIFSDHIGIISDKRNRHGVPFLIHHANPFQLKYEEDVLERYGQNAVKGHYRIS